MVSMFGNMVYMVKLFAIWNMVPMMYMMKSPTLFCGNHKSIRSEIINVCRWIHNNYIAFMVSVKMCLFGGHMLTTPCRLVMSLDIGLQYWAWPLPLYGTMSCSNALIVISKTLQVNVSIYSEFGWSLRGICHPYVRRYHL